MTNGYHPEPTLFKRHNSRCALYHHVLSRAVWSPLRASQRLLALLLSYLDDGESPLIFGIDETIERRKGERIAARGIYRDPVRSSKSHFAELVDCVGSH